MQTLFNGHHLKVSRWHCFNFCPFTFMFWLCIGWLGTFTDRKMWESELCICLHCVRPPYSFKRC